MLRFLERVSPNVVPVNFPIVERINWGSDDLGFPIIMSSRILNSRVEVICDVERFEESHIGILLGRALNLVHGCIDLGAFATGIGLSVELDTVIRPNGWADAIVKTNPELGALCSCCRITVKNQQDKDDFNKALKVVLGEPSILGSLHDLATTLVTYHETPTNCGRVLDSLRKAVAPNEDRKPGWRNLGASSM